MSLGKLLLVDDETSFVESLSERLILRNFEVINAFSGAQALDYLEEHKGVDVVVLDVMMPEMDGIEILGRIKKQHPMVEVILLTGHATVETAVQGIKLGAFDYLLKPCEVEQLTAKALDAIARKRYHEGRLMEELTKPYSLRLSREQIISKLMEEEPGKPGS